MNKKESADRHPVPKIDLRGMKKILSEVEMPKAQNRRLFVVTGALAVVCLAQGLGIMAMLPLKERTPYVIEIEADKQGNPTGNVIASNRTADTFKPNENNVRYFMARWAENLLAVDEQSRERKLPESYTFLRGGALNDWQRYITEQGRPIEKLMKDPSYRVTPELISISFLTDETAMIRVKLTDSKGVVVRVVMNVSFAILPPQTDDEVYKNPIGLWITGFGVTNELA